MIPGVKNFEVDFYIVRVVPYFYKGELLFASPREGLEYSNI